VQRGYAKSLRAFRLVNKVLIVFEHEVIVLNSDPKKNTFEMIHNLPCATITYVTLSHNEKLLGIATTTASTPEVSLF
jgi:hypothetical protein